MKSFIILAIALSVLVGEVSCHYIFQQLTHGGTKYPVYQYIRKNWDYNSPVTDLKSLDTRCNAGGETGNDTQTITMAAGDPFTINTDVAVYHQGPFSIYMAKAPAAAVDFDGSGQVWFKILDLGPTFSGGQATWPLYDAYSYHIPSNLPSGDYLLRFEQLGIHNPYPAGTPQFYIECAQVTVTNGGTGTPGPLVSIPGWVTGTEPGYTVNIYNGLTNYTTPGPAVWADQGTGTNAVTAPVAPVQAVPPVQAIPPVQVPTVAAAAPVQAPTQAVAPQPAASAVGAVVQKYGQCGGTNYKGSTNCAAGTTCKAMGSYYSQCT
ncbi:carbohydrate-binding module family 1 protein [Stipitochalara longipes BDJ]|nr:carbohydrate-binding module family 1 protein [Stipitochalara longipes BDJ]